MVSQNFEILSNFPICSKMFGRCPQSSGQLSEVSGTCFELGYMSAPFLQAVRAETMVDGSPRVCRFFCGLGVNRCQWSIRNLENGERKVEISRDSTD